MKLYPILLIFVLAGCSSEKKESKPNIILFATDTIKYNSKTELDSDISNTLKVLKEKSIRTDDTLAHEFRCYYYPPFRENAIYFRANYLDSTLTIKEFQFKYPDGSGVNALINSKTVKLNRTDFETIETLNTRSLFWSLENFVYPYISIDGETFIYECRQPMSTKIVEMQKDYHIVKAVSPKNFDLGNLGHFFLMKAGRKNIYRANYPY